MFCYKIYSDTRKTVQISEKNLTKTHFLSMMLQKQAKRLHKESRFRT